MAIIRKGDKEAEHKLNLRAIAQSGNRNKASDKKTTKAGLSFINKNKTAITVDPSKIMVSKDKSGKSSANYRGDFKGPISGSAIASSKASKKRTLERQGSGVIQSGRLVKGGGVARIAGLAKDVKKKSGK
jgi:hypothetical protein